MNRRSLMIILTNLLWLFSCKKNEQPGNPSIADFKNERVKTVQSTGGGLSTYTYDVQKRQIKEVQNTGIVTEYIYEPGKMTRLVIQPGKTDSYIYTLNAEGHVKTLLVPDGTTYTYEYSSTGMLTKEYSNEPSPFIATHYYNNATGLLDSIRQTIGGVWNRTVTYTYDMDKSNSLKNENLGLGIYGEEILRPIKRYRSLYKNGNAIKDQITDFTYTYDSKGRITGKMFTDGGQDYSYNYTYY